MAVAMVSTMSGLSLDCKTRLALQFIEDMTSVIDDCRRNDAACSRKELARIKQILVLERSAVCEIDDSCSATKRSDEKQEDPERALHPLLQGLVGRFTEWRTSMIDPQAPKTTHHSDVALFQASIKLLDSRLKGVHVRCPSSSYDEE